MEFKQFSKQFDFSVAILKSIFRSIFSFFLLLSGDRRIRTFDICKSSPLDCNSNQACILHNTSVIDVDAYGDGGFAGQSCGIINEMGGLFLPAALRRRTFMVWGEGWCTCSLPYTQTRNADILVFRPNKQFNARKTKNTPGFYGLN